MQIDTYLLRTENPSRNPPTPYGSLPTQRARSNYRPKPAGGNNAARKLQQEPAGKGQPSGQIQLPTSTSTRRALKLPYLTEYLPLFCTDSQRVADGSRISSLSRHPPFAGLGIRFSIPCFTSIVFSFSSLWINRHPRYATQRCATQSPSARAWPASRPLKPPVDRS